MVGSLNQNSVIKEMHGVYFLTDTCRKSYIGYSNNISKRFRTHALKLKASAKATKRFNHCMMIMKIEGFPTSNDALSFEWFAKRRSLRVHKERLMIRNAPFPLRISKFLSVIKLNKFQLIKHNLILYVHDPHNEWSSDISKYYGIAVRPLNPPYLLEHVRKN